jgi:hypothetical protein
MSEELSAEEMADVATGLAKCVRYGRARNRDTDSEPRMFALTDDEGLAIVRLVEILQGAPLQ